MYLGAVSIAVWAAVFGFGAFRKRTTTATAIGDSTIWVYYVDCFAVLVAVRGYSVLKDWTETATATAHSGLWFNYKAEV